MSESIEQVYMEHKGLLFSLAYRMTGSAAEAEDIVQETFAALAGADLNEIRHVKSYWCTLRPIFPADGWRRSGWASGRDGRIIPRWKFAPSMGRMASRSFRKAS
ncbi:sigma factor [Brevibacillus agri]|uniref:sigma factor n=1 Tax=Brevibacillus agri TaxID=51101 RepID=UPI003D25A18D